MISVPVRDAAGGEAGSYEFDPADLVRGEINRQLLHDAVVMYEANRRVGTVQTKSRGMVQGSTKKLFRQKGTGRARAGNARTPVRRGGGHAFGKKPRDFGYRLPRKAVRSATKMALLSKFQDGQAVILDDWKCDHVDAGGKPVPKTKPVVAALKALGVDGSTVLIATDGVDQIVYRSARNVAGVQVVPASDLNAYSLLRNRHFVVTVSAMDSLLGRTAEVSA
ncbi:MAG: 50S ribosomal protein L4 [Fuerstiella sp.]|jgi:large subunit ribosomal protein L4|nr:50S ribosomal protein L4 [Fuerstiella sp.]